jgi:CubicO group peptidase (beta-lactamase class C family)
MRQGRRSLLGLALLGSVGRVLAAPRQPVQPALDRLDEELAAIVADKACELASLSVLALRNGKAVYEQQLGQRILGAPGQAVTSRTMFRIASISKMMTTFALMMLVEQGKLGLDHDVSDYLGFSLRNPHFPDRVLTLRALLTHTSSLRDDAGYSWRSDIALKTILVPGAALYDKGAMWAANAPPGDYFTYSNLNWGVIGTIMEAVTGERFDRLMKRLLLAPMGLRGGFNPSEFSPDELANLATLYRKRTTDTEVWNSSGPWIAQVDDFSTRAPARPAGIDSYVPGTNATPFSPTGGLRISVPDMGKVMQMLINDGQHEGVQILKPATLARMFTRQWAFKEGNGDTLMGLFQAWGMGNQHFPDAPGTALVEGGGFDGVGHLGEAYGLYSVFAVDLARKSGMIAFFGGSSSDPEAQKGRYSALTRPQERILTALHRRAILGRGD